MAKKIMILTGSPREKGNTNTIVGWLAEGAKEAGASIDISDVTKLKSRFSGCIACLGCQRTEKFECVVVDEVKPVLAAIPSLDVLIFATPTYFFGPSAQLKTVVDRMCSLFKFDPSGGYVHNLGHLKMALVATGSRGIQPGLQLVEDTFKTIAGFAGAGFSSLLVPNASMYSDEIKKDHDLRERVKGYGRALAS